jgi:hypothetical protein
VILDEDGVYDPTHFNDRLLRGLKGTMSEAELHVRAHGCAAASSTRPSAASCSCGGRSPSSRGPTGE